MSTHNIYFHGEIRRKISFGGVCGGGGGGRGGGRRDRGRAGCERLK